MHSGSFVPASAEGSLILVKIDGKGVDYKEVANNMNARILSIGFSKDNRFIEIIGNPNDTIIV